MPIYLSLFKHLERYFYINQEIKGYFLFEIFIYVLVSSFLFIWIPVPTCMLWVYGHYRIPGHKCACTYIWRIHALSFRKQVHALIFEHKKYFKKNTMLMILGVRSHVHAITRLKQRWGVGKNRTPRTMYNRQDGFWGNQKPRGICAEKLSYHFFNIIKGHWIRFWCMTSRQNIEKPSNWGKTKWPPK